MTGSLTSMDSETHSEQFATLAAAMARAPYLLAFEKATAGFAIDYAVVAGAEAETRPPPLVPAEVAPRNRKERRAAASRSR